MSDNYERLSSSDTRYLSDYVYSEVHLYSQEIKDLIADKKAEIIAPFSSVPTDNSDGQRYYYNNYKDVPTWFIDYIYNSAIRMVDRGIIKLFLDDDVDGVHWARELVAGTLEAYNVRDYIEEFQNVPLDTVVNPKALSRTVGTQSIGDMMQSFESERLSMNLQGAFQQYLSTLPNGIEIIAKIQFFQKTMVCCGVV